MQGQPCPTVPTIKQLAKLPLRFEPNTQFAYGLGHDMLAALVEVVTGKKFRDYVKEVVFDPLGMTNSHMHATPDDRNGRLAAIYQMNDGKTSRCADQENIHIYGEEYDSGGAGIISCPADYVKFAMTMTRRGTSPDGSYQLLKPETVDLMRAPQLSAGELATFAACNQYGYSYGLGVRTHIDPAQSGRLSPIGEFGWDGALGAFVSFDPASKVSIVYMQSVFYTPHPINHKDILNTVYKCLEH
jgi:CubicO group peptidase (beta-lactamase class C family)